MCRFSACFLTQPSKWLILFHFANNETEQLAKSVLFRVLQRNSTNRVCLYVLQRKRFIIRSELTGLRRLTSPKISGESASRRPRRAGGVNSRLKASRLESQES